MIFTISSKTNQQEFKEFKQYDYMQVNSIFKCCILLLQMSSWLNECIYPYQVFCPVIRKLVGFQYFKIIIQEVLGNSLRFMVNFGYVAFAFNRIALIGKDHNKLTEFFRDVGINTYIGVCFFISLGLSVIKFFHYKINFGEEIPFFPVSY